MTTTTKQTFLLITGRRENCCQCFKSKLKMHIKNQKVNWRDGSAIKNTCYFYRGPAYGSQDIWLLTIICNSSTRGSFGLSWPSKALYSDVQTPNTLMYTPIQANTHAHILTHAYTHNHTQTYTHAQYTDTHTHTPFLLVCLLFFCLRQAFSV